MLLYDADRENATKKQATGKKEIAKKKKEIAKGEYDLSRKRQKVAALEVAQKGLTAQSEKPVAMEALHASANYQSASREKKRRLCRRVNKKLKIKVLIARSAQNVIDLQEKYTAGSPPPSGLCRRKRTQADVHEIVCRASGRVHRRIERAGQACYETGCHCRGGDRWIC
jgi:hypothetical protein